MLFDDLVLDLKERFVKLEEPRANNATYSVSDILMCGFALFSVKDSSLLKFTKELRSRKSNMKNIFHIDNAPSDTTVRTILDKVPTSKLKPLFKPYLEELDYQGIIQKHEVLDGYSYIPIDGAQYFTSKKVHCENCLTKVIKGETHYHHNALAAVIVNPRYSEVFPVSLEEIVKQDGKKKNDSELAAFKRLVPQIRQNLPSQRICIGGDALYANGPTVQFLQRPEIDMSFIFSVKPGSQGYLFLQVERLEKEGKLTIYSTEANGKKYITKYANGLMLNGKYNDILVNFIQHEEHDLKTGKMKLFSFITDIEITLKNYKKVVQIGRSRWKIENETFNTLKNNGYEFEHNFGHGKENLSANFSVLMFLAFLFDQIQQSVNQKFLAARRKAGSTKALWEKIRQIFDLAVVESMQMIYKIIAKEIKMKIQFII